jgi:hypothetical protein
MRRTIGAGVAAFLRSVNHLHFMFKARESQFEFLQTAKLIQQRGIQAVDVVLKMSEYRLDPLQTLVR